MADEEVKVVDTSELTISASNNTGICFFCNHQFSKYTCPRCNASYCSITCYKSEKHLHCSEGFYKDSVVQEMTSRSKDPKDVENVLKILKNLEEEDQSQECGDVDKPSLEERLGNIDLNNADSDVIWDALTQEEKRDFEATLQSGSLSHLIEEWIPWWKQSQSNQSKADIRVIGSTDRTTSGTEVGNKPTKQPRIPKVLHNIATLTGSANPLIKYSVVDVVYAYAYIMRLYNGAPEENISQSILTLYNLSSSLSNNMNFESLEMVVHNSVNVVLENKDVWNSQEFSYNVLLDVSDILSGTITTDNRTVHFVDCALSDVCRILGKGKKSLKDQQGSEKQDGKKLWLAKKKVEFFISWIQSNREVLPLFVPGIEALHLELVGNYKIHEEKRKMQTKMKEKKGVPHKKLIEEI